MAGLEGSLKNRGKCVAVAIIRVLIAKRQM